MSVIVQHPIGIPSIIRAFLLAGLAAPMTGCASTRTDATLTTGSIAPRPVAAAVSRQDAEVPGCDGRADFLCWLSNALHGATTDIAHSPASFPVDGGSRNGSSAMTASPAIAPGPAPAEGDDSGGDAGPGAPPSLGVEPIA